MSKHEDLAWYAPCTVSAHSASLASLWCASLPSLCCASLPSLRPDALDTSVARGSAVSVLRCMPCRSFTPMLKAAYEQLRALGGEVVFVSSDRDETKYIEYFQAMPWLALPYADRERKMNLASRFRVATIPRLIVLDGDGNLITLHGRTDLPNDPQLGGFPWRVRPASEILRSARLLDAHNSPVALPGSSRTVVALYFTCLRSVCTGTRA